MALLKAKNFYQTLQSEDTFLSIASKQPVNYTQEVKKALK